MRKHNAKQSGWIAFLATSVCLGLVTLSGFADAVELNGRQIALLEELDEESVSQIAEILDEVADWKTRIQDLQKRNDQIDIFSKESEARAESVLVIVNEIIARCRELPESTQAILTSIGACESLMRKAESAWQDAPYDPDRFVILDEASFRAELKAFIMTAAAEQAIALIDKNLFRELSSLDAPVQYVNSFLEGEFREWTKRALSTGDESITFRIDPPSPLGAVFNPDVGLPIVMEYIPGQIEIRAEGLYFRYRKGGTPETVLDKLDVDDRASIAAGATRLLTTLGNNALSELSAGSPFTVTIDKIPDLSKLSSDPTSHAIEFSVKFDWSQLGGAGAPPVSASAKGLLLYPVEEVDTSKSVIRLDYRSPRAPPAPIPIGTTPFAFWDFGGSFAPGSRRITGDTSIATVASPPEAVGLFAELATQPPYRIFELTGSVSALAKAIEMCRVEGTLDFQHGEIKGRYGQGGQFGGALMYGTGEFSLKSERLLTTGSVELLGVQCAKLDSEVHFEDASANLVGHSGFVLFGSYDFGAYLEGIVHSGLKRTEVSAQHGMTLDVQPWGAIACDINVLVDTSEEHPILVTVQTPFGDVKFTANRLDELDVNRLNREVSKLARDPWLQVRELLKQGELGVRDWGAAVEESTRRYLYERARAANVDRISTGIEEFDGSLGEVSQRLKSTGSALADYRQKTPQAASKARDDLYERFKDAGETFQDAGSSAEEKTRNFFGF